MVEIDLDRLSIVREIAVGRWPRYLALSPDGTRLAVGANGDRGVSVVDASPNNDWTQVRVQVGYSNENYGRTYPVYGFIHNRPDTTGGAMFAGTGLRGGAAQAAALGLEEVAQAPSGRGSRR